MSFTKARVSRIASSCPKELDFQYFIFQNEANYPLWLTKDRVFKWLYSLPENIAWKGILCLTSLICLFAVSADILTNPYFFQLQYIDYAFNIQYAVDTVANIYNNCYRISRSEIKFKCIFLLGYIMDFLSYAFYVTKLVTTYEIQRTIICLCYYLRIQKSLRFVSALRTYNLHMSVLETLLKILFIFYFIRISIGNIIYFSRGGDEQSKKIYTYVDPPEWLYSNSTKFFLKMWYAFNKIFYGIRPDRIPTDPSGRVIMIIAVLAGSVVFMGMAIASLSTAIALYLTPEEAFRARLRIILNSFKVTQSPVALRNKVEVYYRMYWDKQKAVHDAKLMTLFPPTLRNAIHTDIYFEAQQKSRVLCDLSYQFLVEIAKVMKTNNYVPGDIIIKRGTPRSTMIYIAFGDVEMLTAEDDESPILRFTRGTILNPCGMCVEVAGSRSHVCVRAATFCTAHLLDARDLWRVASVHGKLNGQTFILHSAFEEHCDKMKRHYATKVRCPDDFKSSILMTKRNLMALKEASNDEGKPLLDRNDMFLEIAGCYMLRNEENVELKSNADKFCLQPRFPCILQPVSLLLVTWQILVSFFTLIICFFYPYTMLFKKSTSTDFEFFNYMMTFMFLLDILVSLSIGSKLEEGVPLTFFHTASRNIGNFWFVIDVLAVLPMLEFVGDGRFAGLNKIIKLLKVLKILKQMEIQFIFYSNVFKFISFIIVTLFSILLLACGIQYVKCIMYQFCKVTDVWQEPYWDTIHTGFDDNYAWTTLLFSLYWALSLETRTSHRSSGATMSNAQNQVIICEVMDISNILNIMLISGFAATMIVTMHRRSEFLTCIESVKNFFMKNDIEPIIQYRFTEYLKLCWYTDQGYMITHNKKTVLFDMPEHVCREMIGLLRSKFLAHIPALKLLNKEVLKFLSYKSRVFHAAPNEILQNTGEVMNEMYVIRRGICEILNPLNGKVARYITTNDYFGDFESIMRLPCFYTVRAVTHVTLVYIKRKHFIKCIATPKVIDSMLYVRQHPGYSQLQNRRDPFVTFEKLPPPPNRQVFPLPRKHIPDTAFQQPFSTIGFFSILRYVFPRFTIHPDGRYLLRCEWFRAACAITSSIFQPMYMILEMEDHRFYYLSLFLDIAAYFDIVQRLLVGYYDEKGILVYHPTSTAAHYLKGAFLVDLMACLPLEYLDSVRSHVYFEVDAYRVTGLQQKLMCNRLVQLYRVPNALNSLNNITNRQAVVEIIKWLPIFLGLISFTSCILLEQMIDKYRKVNGGLRIQFAKPSQSFYTKFQNPLTVRYNITESAFNLILTCFFWTTYEMTSITFDRFRPVSMKHVKTLLVCQFVGFILTVYLTASVLSLRSNVNHALASYQMNIKEMKKFMTRENLDKELQEEVIRYYEYLWDRTSGTDYRTVLRLCDQLTLRTDAILHIYGRTFSKCPLFKKSDLSLLRILGRAVHSVYYRERTTVLERDEVISDMYIVDYGEVEMRHRRDDQHVIVKLPKGSVFGNMDKQDFQVNPNRFVTSSNVHLLKINAVIFNQIITEFHSVKVLLMKYRPNDENFILCVNREQSVVASTWRDRMGQKFTGTKNSITDLNVHNKFVQIYLIIVSLLGVCLDIVNAGFQYNNVILIGILYSLDIGFILKIVINFLFPYSMEDDLESGVEAMSSTKRYLKKEFHWDLLSVIPLELFCLLKQNPWRLFACLRLNRVFRMATIHNCLQRYHQKLFINLTITTLASVVIWAIVYVLGWTCFWNYLSIDTGYSSWKYQNDNQSICTSDLSGSRSNVLFAEFICSLSFVISVFGLLGTDIFPKLQAEVFTVIILCICSFLLYTYFVGAFANIIQYKYFQCFRFYQKYVQLKNFMAANRVAKNLVAMTNNYTLYLWRESQGNQLPHFLDVAPQCLRLKVMSGAYMRHLMGHPIFRFCEPAFLRHLVGSFKPFLYVEGMWVVKEGEITNAMYFVHRGRVQEMDEEMERNLDVYLPGMFFGTAHCLFPDVPYNLSYKTVIKSQILTLSFEDWQFLLKLFPKTRDVIYKQEGVEKDFCEFTTGAAEDKAEKEKKRVQITKAPTVHTLKGLESQLKLQVGAVTGDVAAGAAAVAGTALARGQESKSTPKKDSKLMAEDDSEKEDKNNKEVMEDQEKSSLPLHSRRRSSDSDDEEKRPAWTNDEDEKGEDEEEFPKPKQNYTRRQSTVHNVDRNAVELELKQIQPSGIDLTEGSIAARLRDSHSKKVSTTDLGMSKDRDFIKINNDLTGSPILDSLETELIPEQELLQPKTSNVSKDLYTEKVLPIKQTKNREDEIAPFDTGEMPLVSVEKKFATPTDKKLLISEVSMNDVERVSIDETQTSPSEVLQKITSTDNTLDKPKYYVSTINVEPNVETDLDVNELSQKLTELVEKPKQLMTPVKAVITPQTLLSIKDLKMEEDTGVETTEIKSTLDGTKQQENNIEFAETQLQSMIDLLDTKIKGTKEPIESAPKKGIATTGSVVYGDVQDIVTQAELSDTNLQRKSKSTSVWEVFMDANENKSMKEDDNKDTDNIAGSKMLLNPEESDGSVKSYTVKIVQEETLEKQVDREKVDESGNLEQEGTTTRSRQPEKGSERHD